MSAEMRRATWTGLDGRLVARRNARMQKGVPVEPVSFGVAPSAAPSPSPAPPPLAVAGRGSVDED
jgi:hypothetical protein